MATKEDTLPGTREFETLLGVGGDEASEQTDTNTAEGGGKGPQDDAPKKPTSEEMQAQQGEQIKNLQELLRQQTEELKDPKRLFKSLAELLGHKDENEVNAQRNRDLLAKFDNDPISAVNQLLEEKLQPLENAIISDRNLSNGRRVMEEISREYSGIEWDGDTGSRVLNELKNINPDLKASDPKAAVLRAMKLAEVGKKRPPLPPYSADRDGVSSDGIVKDQRQRAADILRDRINQYARLKNNGAISKMNSALGKMKSVSVARKPSSSI